MEKIIAVLGISAIVILMSIICGFFMGLFRNTGLKANLKDLFVATFVTAITMVGIFTILLMLAKFLE